jgi:predicted dehydrogenase
MSRRAAIVGLSWISADLAGEASDPSVGTAVPYSHASAMAAIPEIEVVAGCDIVPAACERFVARWSGRWPGLRAYDDYRTMFEEQRPEIVSIVTPDHLHTEPVLAAIDAGVRGIFCEKPLATSLEEADRIVAAARSAGVTMNVNYTRRWFPEYVEARRVARSGQMGSLSQIVAQIGGPRAMLYRNHTHIIDLVCYLADGEPDWVIGELEPGFEDYGTTYRGDGGNDPATEPGANYYIAFRNGVRAYVTGMKDTMPGESVIHLTGPTGRLVVDLEGMRLLTYESEDLRTKPGVARIERVTPKWTVAGMQAGILDLLAAMDGRREPTSPPESARMTVALTEAILQSQARGNVKVHLDELTVPARTAHVPST